MTFHSLHSLWVSNVQLSSLRRFAGLAAWLWGLDHHALASPWRRRSEEKRVLRWKSEFFVGALSRGAKRLDDLRPLRPWRLATVTGLGAHGPLRPQMRYSRRLKSSVGFSIAVSLGFLPGIPKTILAIAIRCKTRLYLRCGEQ